MELSSQHNTLADPVRLETIDKLFEFNIGEYVALPQIVVVGDQSSGKSSVLEALTQLPFPRDSGLCTRFATKITFRRSQEQKIAVSIIPSEDATAKHAEKLRGWKQDDLNSLDARTFSRTLQEVYALMGIKGLEKKRSKGDDKQTFSHDVLQIDIQGPEQQHLSVIDLPGIFKKTTPGLTTKSDMAMVKKMVSGYMKNPRAAILTVVPANVDIATQEIIEIAEEHDTERQRTLGVLTKPDLVDRGAEQHVIDLIEGKSHQLGLGWCIVRNLSHNELLNSTSDRGELEESFFKVREPWADLNKKKVGIQALQARLIEVLAEIVRREFPGVKSDINKRLSRCRHQLNLLGPSRDTKEQQQKYLIGLAARFQKIVASALDARYGSDELFEESDCLKLATVIVTRNEQFSDDACKVGLTMGFEPKLEEYGSIDVTSLVGKMWPSSNNKVKEKEVEVSLQRYTDYPSGLSDLLSTQYEIIEQERNEILPWLETLYKSSRGFELGTFDAALIPLIWKKLSANWDALALGYISDVIILVHRFMLGLLHCICAEETVLKGLTSALMEHYLPRYRKAIEHVKFILQVERAGTPLTLNHYFNDNLENCREARIKTAPEKDTMNYHGTKVVAVDTVYKHAQKSNTDHAIHNLYDILKSYYHVARKRFVDVVCMQAADFYLVAGPDTPTKVFSPSFVANLPPKQLQKIAGETSTTLLKRAELKREIRNLEEGRKILV